ncbi:tyrosine-type recombinase/integrase [Pantoea agglomerans]|uniref:tyrosine-type recombinase/integrase n=1 Tax=Enterobacter agglomerans TaxID=549 RepID=UPI003C7D681F
MNPNGSKRWYLKYRYEGKESRAALGAYPLITLTKAREKRDEIRLLLADGISLNAKKEEIKQQEQAALNTFEKLARDRHACNKHWSDGHAERVWRDIERNILPAIGKRNIADLTTRDLS